MNFIFKRYKKLGSSAEHNALKGLFQARRYTTAKEDEELNNTLLSHFYPTPHKLPFHIQITFTEYTSFQKELDATPISIKHALIEETISTVRQELTPDYVHWMRQDWWTEEETVLLACRLEPKKTQLNKLLELFDIDETAKKALLLKELIDRSELGILLQVKRLLDITYRHIKPQDFYIWCIQKQVDLPDEMIPLAIRAEIPPGSERIGLTPTESNSDKPIKTLNRPINEGDFENLAKQNEIKTDELNRSIFRICIFLSDSDRPLTKESVFDHLFEETILRFADNDKTRYCWEKANGLYTPPIQKRAINNRVNRIINLFNNAQD